MAETISWKIVEYLHQINRTLRVYGGNFGGPSTQTLAGPTNPINPVMLKHNDGDAASPVEDHSRYSSSAGNLTSRKVIACVGDSITEGLGASDPSLMSYPAILQRHPGFHHYIVKNFGVSAYCASKHAGRFSYWRHPRYKAAMESNPAIVIIQLGTNDAHRKYWREATFIRDYKEMILGFVNLPSKPTVYLCIPPPIYGTPEKEEDKQHQYNINVEFPNRIIPQLAKETGAVLINNFEALGGRQLLRPDTMQHKEWPHDHLHPNDFGYLALAHEIAYAVHTHQRELAKGNA